MFRTTFIVAAFCLLGVAVEAKPQTKCIEQAADIMFVLDSSTSIWIRHYRQQLKFVADLVQSFGVGKGDSQIRIGAITFSNQSYLEFPLGRYNKPAQLKTAILGIPHRGGRTNTADALRLLKKQVEPNLKNSKVPTIAIVITDGQSMDPTATKQEAEKLHDLGITVYAIGVGNSSIYDINELKAIASDPENGVYTVSSYPKLKKIRKTFYVNVCKEKNTSPKPTTQTTANYEDSTTAALPVSEKEPQNAEPGVTDASSIILFGYDLIGMGVYRSGMIHQIINTILPYTGYGHFGVVSYGYCPTSFNVPITPLTDNDPSIIGNRIPDDIELPNLTDVVRQMRNMFHIRSMRHASSGHSEKQVAVLFVEPAITTFTPELTKEIEILKKNGVKLYLVNVGACSWPQPDQLYSMSSQPYDRYILNASSYHQLLLKVQYDPFHFKPMYNEEAPKVSQRKPPPLY